MPEKLSGGLRIRSYEPSDDEACRLLEVTASQFQHLGGLIKAAIKHHGAFDAKAYQFVDHVLIVCVDDAQQGAVCGVIVVAIKQAWVHGKVRRCGFVFDLRVDERWQRRGIGEALAREAELRSAQAGVDYLYLSVNRSNAKALRLYQRLGWSVASARRLVFTLLLWPPSAAAADMSAAAAGGGVRACTREEGVALAAAHYASRDLGLVRRRPTHP